MHVYPKLTNSSYIYSPLGVFISVIFLFCPTILPQSAGIVELFDL